MSQVDYNSFSLRPCHHCLGASSGWR